MNFTSVKLYSGISLSVLKKLTLFLSSLAIVSLGQPAWVPLCGPLAAAFGFALIFWVLVEEPEAKKRFLLGSLWFFIVQLFQLSWSITHPYAYIYPVWAILSGIFGMQFGLLAIMVTKERIQSWTGLFLLPSFWILMEWSRLFLFSGISWNPVGLALTTFLVPFQAGSILGVYGLSFLVILTNIFTVRWFIKGTRVTAMPCMAFILFPYIFGLGHLAIHYPKLKQDIESGRVVDVLLVQTGFPVEEVIELNDPQSTLLYTYGKWKEILSILSRHHREGIDMIVFPEYVVPYGTYYPVYPFESVRQEFRTLFGEKGVKALPPLEDHFAVSYDSEAHGKMWMVNNAFWVQGISNLFNAEVIAGLEDTDVVLGNSERYCSAMVFFPDGGNIERYEKRVLVPLGEYIPFDFLREVAARYSVSGSLTPGKKAKVVKGRASSYGLSICYEETYGNIMRDNRLSGADMLVNLTNDFWYPNSRLTQQHFDHARMRAIEMGIPLVRSTNTGLTAAVDSLGQTLAILGEEDGREDLSDALLVTVPRYHYRTLYTYLGDFPLILFSALFCFGTFAIEKGKKRIRTKKKISTP